MARREARDTAKSTQDTLKKLEPGAVDIASAGSSAPQWRATIENSSRLRAPEDIQHPATLRDAMLDEAALFLWNRVGSFDPDRYIAWRAASGYRMNDLDMLRVRFGVYDWYERIFDRPPSEDATPESLFRDLASVTPQKFDGSQIPTLLATDSSAIAVSMGWSDHPAGPVFPPLASELDTSVWQGNTLGFSQWWLPDASYSDIFEAHGRVLVGAVGVIMKFESGDWRPVIMKFQHDPRTDRWHLYTVTQRESPNDLVVAWDY